MYRNHKKMVVLDDRVAFVGGINIADHNYAWHDFMVKITGPLAADIARDFRSTWAGSTVALGEPSSTSDYVLNQTPGRPSISNELLRMIERARWSIVIESPSLLGGTRSSERSSTRHDTECASRSSSRLATIDRSSESGYARPSSA